MVGFDSICSHSDEKPKRGSKKRKGSKCNIDFWLLKWFIYNHLSEEMTRLCANITASATWWCQRKKEIDGQKGHASLNSSFVIKASLKNKCEFVKRTLDFVATSVLIFVASSTSLWPTRSIAIQERLSAVKLQ